MSGESVRAYHASGPVVLEASGGSITNNAIAAANDTTFDLSSYSDFPNCDFTLAVAFGTAPTEGTVLALVARLIDIDGTNDAQAPEFSRQDRIVGRFVVDNVTTTQYLQCTVMNCPRKADYYLANVATGQTVSSGWTLKAQPWAFKVA